MPHTFHTAAPLRVTYYNNTGRYDRTVRVRPDQFPILSGPPYDGWDWDRTQYMLEELGAIHDIILYDDVPALRELLRLIGPEMFPTIIYAAEMGRVRILKALLDYRDSLTPAQHDPVTDAYEYRERSSDMRTIRPWGTPLTTRLLMLRVLLDAGADNDARAGV
ncbi:hypothetical protein SEUCBS139899_002152 [Sporothrix eucalyptigena]